MTEYIKTIRGDYYEKNAIKLFVKHFDNPKELKKLYKIIVKNNTILRNNVFFLEDLVELHEIDEDINKNIYVEKLITKYNELEEKMQTLQEDYNNLENDTQTLREDYNNLENETQEKWIEHIEPVEDNIRKSYQSQIDKLKKERDDYKKQLEYREKKYKELNNKYNDKISPLMTDKQRLTSEINKLKKLNEKMKKVIETDYQLPVEEVI